MQLKKGEVIIKTGKAKYDGGSDKRSTYPGYGTLYLTNRRLVFEYTKSIAGMLHGQPEDNIEIPLAAIRSVQRGDAKIPLGILVIKVDYSYRRESKFLLLRPTGEYTYRYGSRKLVSDWLGPIRKMANLPAEPEQPIKYHPINLILLILLILIIIAIIAYIGMYVHLPQ